MDTAEHDRSATRIRSRHLAQLITVTPQIAQRDHFVLLVVMAQDQQFGSQPLPHPIDPLPQDVVFERSVVGQLVTGILLRRCAHGHYGLWSKSVDARRPLGSRRGRMHPGERRLPTASPPVRHRPGAFRPWIIGVPIQARKRHAARQNGRVRRGTRQVWLKFAGYPAETTVVCRSVRFSSPRCDDCDQPCLPQR